MQSAVTDQTGQSVDDATEQVKGTVENLEGTATSTIDQVTDEVGALLGPDVPPDPGGGGPGPGEGPGPGDGPGPTEGPGPTRDPKPGGARPSDPPTVIGVGQPGPSTAPSPIASRQDIPGFRTADRGLLNRIGGTLRQAAKGIGFPLVLVLIVIAFLMVQNRLDRKDPKLALAPIRPDTLKFA